MKLSLQPCRRWLGEFLLAAGLLIAVSIPAQDCVPAPDGLVGWWPGDGNANDIAGTNNGILEGGAAANAAGKVGQAFSFDGTNGYVQIPDSAVFHPTNLTVEYWVCFTSLDSQGSGGSPPGDQYVVFKQNSLTYNFEGFDLRKIRIDGTDIFKFAVSSAAAQTAELHATNVVVATGVWYHVAGVRGSNYIQIYVNGQLEGQTNVDFPQDYGTNALYFGTSGETNWDHKLYGLLDEVSLYDRALSSNEVAAIYAAGAAGKCKGTNGVSITVQPQSQTAVSGTNVILTVAAAGVAPLNYQWQFNGAALVGATSTNLTLADIQSTNSGNYQVVVSNPAGSVISAVAVLTVAGPPVLLNPRTTADGAFTFTVVGATGLAYVIEVSTNLVAWTPLGSVSNETGQADFIDSASSSSVSRFYRASWVR